MGSEYGSVGGDGAAFAQTLETLKREGSNVLVVGSETRDAHAAVCQRLCGTVDTRAEDGPASHHRYQLFVGAGDTRSSEGLESATVDADSEGSETVERIEYPTADLDSDGDDDGTGRAPLEALGSEIIETIEDFDDDADGLDPSDLRVCVESLVSLLHDHNAETVFRLLHMTTSGVGHVNGMGHYHLPLDRDHEAVSLLEPLFDVVVELRSRNGSREQRWHLTDRETTTDWVAL